MKRRILRTLLCSLLLAGLAAQASPQEQLAEGQAAVINALVAGAEAHAPRLLEKARLNLQRARDAMVRREFERAGEFARQARADAAQAESRSLTLREARLAAEGQPATR